MGRLRSSSPGQNYFGTVTLKLKRLDPIDRVVVLKSALLILSLSQAAFPVPVSFHLEAPVPWQVLSRLRAPLPGF